MSDNEGVLVSNDSGVYFIPGDQLSQYKLADDAASSVTEAVGGDDEVSGFAMKGGGRVESHLKMRPLKFAFGGDFKPQALDMQYSDNPVASRS